MMWEDLQQTSEALPAPSSSNQESAAIRTAFTLKYAQPSDQITANISISCGRSDSCPASRIRYDYLLADEKCDQYIEELCKNHVSGTLKVAPEHISDAVLACMHKPSKDSFIRFVQKYKKANEKLGLKQYLIPYLISSHPGSRLEDGAELALFLKDYGFVPDQVQDFYPTPGTLATCMYYTGIDPLTKKKVYVARTMEEKKMQRALLHFHKRENRETVKKALEKIGRSDLFYLLTSQKHHKNKRM